MERIRRGDIWTVTLPSFPKPRPAQIVSIDPINDLRPDVIVVPITSLAGPLRVAVPKAAETALTLESYAKCESGRAVAQVLPEGPHRAATYRRLARD